MYNSSCFEKLTYPLLWHELLGTHMYTAKCSEMDAFSLLKMQHAQSVNCRTLLSYVL